MRSLVISCLVLSLLGVGWVGGAAAQDEAGDAATAATDSLDTDTAVGDDRSWLTRTLQKYFGDSSLTGEDLQGTAVEIVNDYEAFVDMNIAVVIVHQVDRFDPQWDKDKDSGTRLFNSLIKPVHSLTRDRIIREYLLFKQGEPLDPFLLADSERLLRNLDFIDDARIILVPLSGESDSVVVVVETRDKWPYGISGTAKDVNRFNLDLFFSNVGGYGIRWDNRAIYRGDMEPELGYLGQIRKGNIGGSFIETRLMYEDSWAQLSRQAEIQRRLVHPGIKVVGGAYWEYSDDRDNEEVPRKYQLGDYWLGRTIRLTSVSRDHPTARPVLVPAVRYRKLGYLDRPEASAEKYQEYLDTKDYLLGLTYQMLKYYKSSHLFRMGETENVPSGFTAKISGGYQDREVYERTSGFAQVSYISVRNKGDILMGLVNWGGYLHDHVLEDGAFHAGGTYITRLMGGGRYRHRLYAFLHYTLAFNRDREGTLVLGNRTGLRGLEDNKVVGSQRLILKLESRVFTPWRVMGFDFMVFGYADLGTVGGESDSVVQQKLYSSIGLGVRIDNPTLSLPATQIRVGFLNSVEENGFALGFRLGPVDYNEFTVPTTRPGGFAFN